jgi:hypothetical protein
MTAFELKSIDIRMTSDVGETDLPAYDHTKLSNINTCPTWGILRYSLHKRMPGANRAMALEAGAAAHESFAALRWFQYYNRQADSDAKKLLAKREGSRIFGEDRFDAMYTTIKQSQTDRTNAINFCLEALYTSGFYDDPLDTNRTVTNVSEGIICYVDAYDLDRYPIYENENHIGVEISFDTVVTIKYRHSHATHDMETKARFTGKLDGLHYNKGRLMVQEDKTGARLDDAWLSQWIMSHQITGYCLAASAFTNEECLLAQVTGMKIPIAKNPMETIRKEMVNRVVDPYINQWANWYVHSVMIDQTYKDCIEDAPKYTHSCNRYFRPCSFIPYCTADADEKRQIVEEMETDEWSPITHIGHQPERSV